ncbi:unnamed protein product [Owenia fusiformis]|uniref:Uncharacterized protein n=1 Tax=Owenia fusiformis TaxID=6347 RepID=A0A8J1TNA4_OWEFU|nr:unnamed protein product [Owenia fusiformis]
MSHTSDTEVSGSVEPIIRHPMRSTRQIPLPAPQPVNNKSKPTKELSPAEAKRKQLKVWKNVLVVAVAFLMNFTAFQSLSNLQSSLNREEGLGVAGLSVVYAALVISCMFLPTILIKNIGCKWTIMCSLLTYAAYIAANFYATWGTIIPGAIILGLGAAPLWSAKCTYLTETAEEYSGITKETTEAVINRFFGVFFFIFQSGQIWGNLISSLVLTKLPENGTDVIPEYILQNCGAQYCQEPEDNSNSNLERPELSQVYMLCGIYLSCSLLSSVITAIFLDNLKSKPDDITMVTKQQDPVTEPSTSGSISTLTTVYASNDLSTNSVDDGENASNGHEIVEFDASKENLIKTESCWKRLKPQYLIATLRHMKHRSQLLLIPLTIYSGLEQAFLASDYTKAYVSCALGIWMVGYVIICFGVTNALCSLIFGRLVKYVGRIPFFVLGAVLNYGVQITLLIWQPSANQLAVFFAMSALWGMSDAVWQTQINALYGSIFTSKSEPAFANYRLWESLGFIIAYAYSNFLCISTKIYILMTILTVGMISYGFLEFRERRIAKLNRMEELREEAYSNPAMDWKDYGTVYETNI